MIASDPGSSIPPRHWPLDGTYNVRDIGGYQTRHGGQTRWRTLWRADSLHRLSTESQQALLIAGLKTVVDLRFADEVIAAPNVFARSNTVHYHNIPLFPGAPSAAAVMPRSLEDVYRAILDDCQPSVKAVLDVLTVPDNAPYLIHCTVGKDRTGMITALVLGALDVPDETIVSDYTLTTQYVQPLLIELRAQSQGRGVPSDGYERMLESQAELMQHTLTYLSSTYGGAAAYLQTIGIMPAQLDALRETLVSPAV